MDKLLEIITNRTSVRQYKQQPIETDKLNTILNSAILAPSGKNGQTWRFVVVQQDKTLIHNIAELVQYSKFAKTADCLICVFMDKDSSYDYIKDCQAIGACIENMLLTATSLGIGSCWIGEIVSHQTEVKELLQIDNARYDLMAVISLGYPLRESKTKTPRKPLEECILEYK